MKFCRGCHDFNSRLPVLGRFTQLKTLSEPIVFRVDLLCSYRYLFQKDSRGILHGCWIPRCPKISQGQRLFQQLPTRSRMKRCSECHWLVVWNMFSIYFHMLGIVAAWPMSFSKELKPPARSECHVSKRQKSFGDFPVMCMTMIHTDTISPTGRYPRTLRISTSGK